MWYSRRADSRFGEVEGRYVKVLESNLKSLFSVLGRIPGGFGHNEGVLIESGCKPICYCVFPNLWCYIPILH